MTSSKADILRASRQKEKKRTQRKHLFGLILLGALVGSFLSLLNLDFFRATEINVAGSSIVDKKQLKSFVSKQLTGRYIFLIPKNSVFFISKKTLSQEILKSFPVLAEASLSWPNLNTLELRIADGESRLLWCVESSGESSCFRLAKNGIAFQTAPNFSDSLFLEFRVKGSPPALGSRVIEAEALSRAIKFLDLFRQDTSFWEKSKLEMLYANVFAYGDFSLVLEKKSDPIKQTKIFFNTEHDPVTTFANLQSVLANDDFQTEWRHSVGGLDYLDLRFPNKVFYQFR